MTSKVKVKCLECGKKFAVSPKNSDPQCPKCGGVDIDIRDDKPLVPFVDVQHEHHADGVSVTLSRVIRVF